MRFSEKETVEVAKGLVLGILMLSLLHLLGCGDGLWTGRKDKKKSAPASMPTLNSLAEIRKFAESLVEKSTSLLTNAEQLPFANFPAVEGKALSKEECEQLKQQIIAGSKLDPFNLELRDGAITFGLCFGHRTTITNGTYKTVLDQDAVFLIQERTAGFLSDTVKSLLLSDKNEILQVSHQTDNPHIVGNIG